MLKFGFVEHPTKETKMKFQPSITLNGKQIAALQSLDIDDNGVDFQQEMDGDRADVRVLFSNLPGVQDPHDIVVDVDGHSHTVPGAEPITADELGHAEADDHERSVQHYLRMLRQGKPFGHPVDGAGKAAYYEAKAIRDQEVRGDADLTELDDEDRERIQAARDDARRDLGSEQMAPKFGEGDLVELRSGAGPFAITGVLKHEGGFRYSLRHVDVKAPFGPDPVHEERELYLH